MFAVRSFAEAPGPAAPVEHNEPGSPLLLDQAGEPYALRWNALTDAKRPIDPRMFRVVSGGLEWREK